MFDPFMMGGMPGGFGFGGPGGFGGMDDEMDPYGAGLDEEMDEHQELLVRLSACMPMYRCDTFEDTLESVCYVCNVDRASLSEEDVDMLEEMFEEE